MAWDAYLKVKWDNENSMDYAKKQAMKEGREEGIRAGKEEGIKEGIKEGKEEGKEEVKLEIARNMKAKGFEIEIISEVTGLMPEEVRSA